MDPHEQFAKHGAWLLPIAFLALLAVEAAFPLRGRARPRVPRLAVNFAFTALAFLAGFLVVRPVAFAAIAWADAHSWGLLHAVPLPGPFGFGAGFLLLDLTFYYWHRANHEVSLLWRFHRVHHVDPDLDVTTSFRFHFGEVLYSAPFRFAQAMLLGVAPALYVAYEVFFQLATMFHHSNLRLPIWIERVLNLALVTPRMHGIHHSVRREETNTNYSVIFRFWDDLNRSLRLNVPQGEIVVGLGTHRAPADNGLSALLVLPFRGMSTKESGPYPPRRVGVAPGRMLE